MSANQPGNGSLSGMEQRISACRAAVGHTEKHISSDEHANLLKELADALMVDHAASHKLDIIEEAISVYEQVLRLRPSGHERRAEAASDLGDALFLFCLHHRADESRAHWSLELLREVVLLRPPGHPLRGRSLHILAKALFFVNYGQGSGDLLALTESILLNREALQLRPINHPERANSLSNLGAALMEYFKRYGDLAFIEESICVNREALQLWGPGHPLRDAALTNLAAALHEFTSHQGGLEVLAEVDSLLREALDQCPPGHPMRYQALENLSGSLQNRFELQGLPAALSEAIALRRQACELIPANHPDGWRPRNNLAWSLTADFRSQRDLSTITEAITLLRQALLGRHGNPVRHILLDSLAEALLAHFTEFKDTAYLIEAIDLQRDVLLLCPRGHTHRPKALHRLAHMLSRPECQSWSEALTLFSEAKECCPAGHPSRALLSSDMSKCFLDPASPFFDLAKGISHLSEGYSNELSHVNQRLGQAVSDLRQLEMAFMHAMREADASTRDPLSSHVLDLYIQAVGLLPRAANFGLDHKLRLQVITGSDEISRNAAARAIFRGQSSQAIEILEEGRGIFWSQTLHLRETRFDGVPEGDRRTMLRLLGMLAHGAQEAGSLAWTEAQREEASERRRQLNEEAEALISRIRAYPGCTRFMLPAVFENLLNGLPDGYVVILNASSLGYHALLLQKATGLAASLELELPSTGFHIAALRAQIPRDMIVQTEQKSKDDVPSRAMRLNSGKAFSFDVVLSQLWASMVQPVIRMMNLGKATGRARPRLWWCVTGELGFLPIHAAGEFRGGTSICTADYVVSSYIPTLSSLNKTRSGWEPIPRASIAGLLICETYEDNASARYLPNAEEEVCLVRECFGSAQARVLNAHSPHTSLVDLRAVLERAPAHILHLACHGVQDAEPLNSALVMHDGRLTIEDMLQLSLPQAVLAYLSACQTAKGDKNAPDQAVHLAASMLFCGFRSVVGTMWLMHDEDGPRLARRFYESLFAQEILDLDDIAYALDEAVQHLRNQGVPAQRWALFMHMGG